MDGRGKLSRLRGDDGAVVVEAALILPLLLFLMMGLIDFGMLLLRTSQASSAARDGARLGILNYAAADVSGSADRTAIEEAVRAKLVGLSLSSIDVDCVDDSDVTVSCADASPNVDYIRVSATWDYEPLTFVGGLLGEHSFTSTSKMAINGQRVTVPDVGGGGDGGGGGGEEEDEEEEPEEPTECQILDAYTSPNPVKNKVSGPNSRLEDNLNFYIKTNGHFSCLMPQLKYQVGDDPAVLFSSHTFVGVSDNVYHFRVGKNSHNNWTVGVKVAEAKSGTAETTFNFEVN